MRQIGRLTEEDSTKKLIAFLLTEEIKAIAEPSDRGWEIWIKEEDDVDRSKKHFAEFEENPDALKYSEAVEKANQLARDELDRLEKNRQNLVVVRNNWSRGNAQRKPLVLTMMILSVVVFMTTQGWKYNTFGPTSAPERTVVLKSLLFIDPDDAVMGVARYIEEGLAKSKNLGLSSSEKSGDLGAFGLKLKNEANDDVNIKLTNIYQGQFWRLFTPMFIHFGLLHILFNMMWLNALGGQFENRLGTTRFGVFVLTAAVVSGFIQQMMPENMQGTGALTICGGMSGVNYALAGFIWMKSLYEPRSGFFLSPVSIFILILWMFMGIFDGGRALGMANWAHGAGFVFGLVCGYLPILRPTSKP
ncbi:MAG: rhomboid family intramembrane serine protease [Planctomycetota bacterium]|nr:rhomboid family intramembrane serine protease [Planctomycetota bacterium]